MSLKEVEKIRRKVAYSIARHVADIRSFVSCTDGNAAAIEQLRGTEGDKFIALLTDTILAQLGHETEIDASKGRNHSRRATRGLAGA